MNPGVHVPAGITALTGIDNDMLADAPPFERIARELRERLEGRVFVAHNVRFDYGFIRREFAASGRLRGAVPTCARCGCRARCIRTCRATISMPSWNAMAS